MKQLNLHGVEVCIATPHEIEKAGANPDEWHRMDTSGALILQPLQRRDAPHCRRLRSRQGGAME